ncbi:MAG: hypothetical protein ABEL51_15065 [Salinibacter sp.]
MLPPSLRTALLLLLLGATLLAGCTRPAATPEAEPAPITDRSYLTAELWNDGQAEVAFYRVERTRDQYGRANEQRFLAGSYLVKHRFSPETMSKVTDGSGGVSSFKYAFFYELESGSYQYKRNWVVNARQRDLRPFKQSFTSFDWCSNLYREIAFPRDGAIEVRKRSDDYGNRRTEFAAAPQSYPPAQLPLLIRALDFRKADTLSFSVAVADSGTHVPAQAVLVGTETVPTEADTFETERIRVSYQAPVPSIIGEKSARVETYWRATGPDRLLVQMAAEGGRYRMTLVEHLRTPYWKENLWPKLDRVDERP